MERGRLHAKAGPLSLPPPLLSTATYSGIYHLSINVSHCGLRFVFYLVSSGILCCFENNGQNTFYNSIVLSPVFIFSFLSPLCLDVRPQRKGFAHSTYHQGLSIFLVTHCNQVWDSVLNLLLLEPTVLISSYPDTQSSGTCVNPKKQTCCLKAFTFGGKNTQPAIQFSNVKRLTGADHAAE